jgi:2-polyprenyl-6-methoxyphenol hydroxylase-like FAD-dependent oxidoreductase
MPARTIAIAGAGPAGLSAALFLHRDGHRVTIFERFDVPRPLGSGLMLQPTGLAVLAELGLVQKILALGCRIDRLFGRVTPSQRVILDVRYRYLRPDFFGLAVHRAALFTPLFEAVRQDGITIETSRNIARITTAADGRITLVFDDGSRAGLFDFVVDALGTRTPLATAFDGQTRRELAYGALWASLAWPEGIFDPHALEQRYLRANTMIGVLPIGRRSEGGPEETAFFWSIKPSDYDAWRAAGLGAWKTQVSRLWPETAPLLDAITDAEQMTLARYSHHTLAHPVAGRLVAIGDSAHAASPQLGQGANMAMLDARALALALRGNGDIANGLARYAALRRRHIRFYQFMSAIFTPFYQSDSRLLPPLRDWFVAPATRLPIVRRFVAGTVAGTIFDPRRQLGLGGRAVTAKGNRTTRA